MARAQEATIAVIKVDLDPELIRAAKELSGESSDHAVIELALRRLIASKQKGAMVDGILQLTDGPGELGSPVESYDTNES